MNKKIIGMTAAAMVLVGSVAAIAAYTTKQSMEASTVVNERSTSKQHPHRVATATVPAPQHQAVLPPCDDKNIVGTVAGGVAGGVIGSQIGKGSGKTAATIGGVAGGALLGNEFIPTRNVTCR